MDGSDILTLWLIVAWLGLSIMVGWAATEKGRRGGSWFTLALFFSPFFAVLVLIACPAIMAAPQEAVAKESGAGVAQVGRAAGTTVRNVFGLKS